MNLKKCGYVVIGTLFVQSGFVQSVNAFQAGGVLIGKVVDAKSGEVLAGVQVVVTSNSLQGEQSVETDSSGLYRLPNLPAGVYTVQFFMGGYEPFANPNPVVLRANQSIRLNSRLRKIGTPEITLVIDTPSVDVTSNSSETHLDEEFISRIPVAPPAASPQKSFEAIAASVPGAQADAFGTSIAGTTSPENGYKVDGLSVGNPGFGTNGSGVSLEFLSEVQVISGGYMPEYGRSTGGTIAATTRSGSNELHGAAWISASPGALEGSRRQIRSERSAILTETNLAYIGDVGARVDGPLILDKLWFSVGVQASQQRYKLRRGIWELDLNSDGETELDSDGFTKRSLVSGTQELFDVQGTQLQAIGKLSYAINEDHRLSLTGFYNPNWSGDEDTFHLGILGGAGGRLANNANLNGQADALGRSTRGATTDVALQWQATADNKRWTFDTSFGIHHETSESLPRDRSAIGSNNGLQGDVAVVWGIYSPLDLQDFEGEKLSGDSCDGVSKDGALVCGVQGYQTGGPGGVSVRKMDRYQLRHTTSRTFQALGHHTIKGGIDMEYTSFDHQKGFSGGTLLFDYSGRGRGVADFRQYGILTGPDDATISPYLQNHTSMVVAGAFIQDSWAIMDKVTLNAGIRYDGSFIYGGDNELFIALPKQFAPRVGLVWDPSQKGKSKIYAQYARYYQGMSLDVADRQGSIESGARTTHDFESCWDLRESSPDHQEQCIDSRDAARYFGGGGASRFWGATGAAKSAVDPNLKPQSSDEVSAGIELNVMPQAKVSLVYQKRWLNSIIEDVSRDEGNTYFIANPCEGIASDFDCPVRKYDAVQFAFTKSYSNHWLAQASYQWSHTRGNIAGLFRPETNQLDPNINSDFDLQSLMANRTGDLSTDRRHEIKLYTGGDYPIGKRFAVDGGLAFTSRSGAPTNYLGSHPSYGPRESFLLQRGSGERLPWKFDLSLNIGGVFKIGKSSRLKAAVEIFNVANFQQKTGTDQLYANDSSLLPLEGETDPNVLSDKVDELAKSIADEENEKNKVTDPEDPKYVSEADARARILNNNFGKATSYQAPRSFRFTLRFEF